MTTQLLSKELLESTIADWEAARDEIPFGLGDEGDNTLAALKFALAAYEQEPVAWTDAEELRDADGSGSGYLFKIGGDANKFADPRRQIKLFSQPVLSIPAAVPEDFDAWFDDVMRPAMRGIQSAEQKMIYRSTQLAWSSSRAAILPPTTIQPTPALESTLKSDVSLTGKYEQEPVAEIIQGFEYDGAGELINQRSIDYNASDIEDLPVGTKLYAELPASCPAPSIPAAVPEEATPGNIQIIASIRPPHGVAFQLDADECKLAADIWNACRGAMIQTESLTPAAVPNLDRKGIAEKVDGKCSRIPGATFYNAAEFALDEVEACLTSLSNHPSNNELVGRDFDFNDFMYGVRRSGPFRGETLADNLKDNAVVLIGDAFRAAMLQSEPVKAAEPIYEYYPDNGWSECNSKEHYEELTELGHRTRIVYVAPKGV